MNNRFKLYYFTIVRPSFKRFRFTIVQRAFPNVPFHGRWPIVSNNPHWRSLAVCFNRSHLPSLNVRSQRSRFTIVTKSVFKVPFWDIWTSVINDLLHSLKLLFWTIAFFNSSTSSVFDRCKLPPKDPLLGSLNNHFFKSPFDDPWPIVFHHSIF